MRLVALLAAAGVAVAAPAPKPASPAKPALLAKPALPANPGKPDSPTAKLVLKAGQAVAFPASVVEGKVVLGPARLGAFGKLEPADGEIAVGLSKRDKDLYDQLVVVEKTSAPVDFVATGMVGEIKIDERVLTGRLDAPVTQRIGGTSWTVWLHEFEPGAAGK